MNILITGSSGFIGNKLVKYLKNSNLLLLTNSKLLRSSKSNQIILEYNKISDINKIIHFKPDYFFHLGSPTDKVTLNKSQYFKWLYESKKLLNKNIATQKNL